MSEQTIRSLVAIEWDFVQLDVSVGQLMDALSRIRLAETELAAEDLQSLRSKLRFILSRLDKPVTQAVEAFEDLQAAPF